MGLEMAWKQCAFERRRPPLGLKNLGNSCYLNSVLQCLTYTPPLAQFCLSSKHSSLCKRLFSNKECPFCILERQIARSLKLDSPLDAPSKLQKCLNLFAANFRWGRQEDAHEFLRYVIDACHNTCLKLLKNHSTCCNGSAVNDNGGMPNGALRKEEASETCTIMNQIFGGSLLSQVKCLSCKGESNKTDDIMDISLDLFESNSLRDSLCKFFRAEVLDGSNKYNCQRCKKLSAAEKQMFIVRAPNVLVIQLKRFEGVHGGKINHNVEFEELLELSNYVYKPTQVSEPKYDLFGSIVHSGYSLESGHYYAYIKDSCGRWYCCNDAHVSLSSAQEVLSEKVYILFYLRSSQHPKATKTGSPCEGVKPAVSSQIGTSTCENSADSSKPLAIINNGQLHCNNDVLCAPNDDKIPANTQLKPVNLENLETPRFITNGDKKLKAHANGKSNGAKQFPDIEKTMPQSEICMEEHRCSDNLDFSSAVSNNSAVLKNNGIHTLSNIVRRCSSSLIKSHEKDAASNLLTGRKGSSSRISSSGQSSHVSSKRKLHDNERADALYSSENLCVFSSNGMKNSSEELYKFKEFLSEEALSGLRSCDWLGKVHDFMRAGKKSRTHAAGPWPNKTELKKELINDARDNFISEIPGSLKAHLIDLLKSFSQSHCLLDI